MNRTKRESAVFLGKNDVDSVAFGLYLKEKCVSRVHQVIDAMGYPSSQPRAPLEVNAPRPSDWALPSIADSSSCAEAIEAVTGLIRAWHVEAPSFRGSTG